MKSLELFSGAGGLAKGLELAGFEHSAFVEFNRDACQTLRTNFDPEKVFEGDIRDYDFSGLGEIDLVAGGPPCQPFSMGGKHKASDDLRDMFPYAIKAISELRPRFFIFENVKGLLRASFAEYFEYIILRLEYPDCTDTGFSDWQDHLTKLRQLSSCADTPPEYNVEYQLINAVNYGIPQTRERVIVVGVRADVGEAFTFPKAEHSLERLLWEQYVSGEYWERHGLQGPLDYSHSPHFIRRIERIKNKYVLAAPAGKPWMTMRDVLSHLPDPTIQHDIADHEFRGGRKKLSRPYGQHV